MANEPVERRALRLRRAGAVVQGLLLGLFCVPAVIELLRLAGNVAAFKYQGF